MGLIGNRAPISQFVAASVAARRCRARGGAAVIAVATRADAHHAGANLRKAKARRAACWPRFAGTVRRHIDRGLTRLSADQIRSCLERAAEERAAALEKPSSTRSRSPSGTGDGPSRSPVAESEFEQPAGSDGPDAASRTRRRNRRTPTSSLNGAVCRGSPPGRRAAHRRGTDSGHRASPAWPIETEGIAAAYEQSALPRKKRPNRPTSRRSPSASPSLSARRSRSRPDSRRDPRRARTERSRDQVDGPHNGTTVNRRPSQA